MDILGDLHIWFVLKVSFKDILRSWRDDFVLENVFKDIL